VEEIVQQNNSKQQKMSSQILTVKDVMDDFPEGWDLIYVSEDTSVADALEIMRKHKIISLPGSLEQCHSNDNSSRQKWRSTRNS
jgi:CBS-domain-containing membrane protein